MGRVGPGTDNAAMDPSSRSRRLLAKSSTQQPERSVIPSERTIFLHALDRSVGIGIQQPMEAAAYPVAEQ